jgi:hypothetical protein
VRQDAQSFCFRSLSINVGLVQLLSVLLQGKDIVGKYNNLITSLFMVIHKELAVAKFVGVHRVEQLFATK